jgi:hypothetical protein
VRTRDRLRLLELLLGDLPGALDFLAQAELHTLLTHGNETAVVPSGHQQPQGVRPYVDDPDVHGADSHHAVGRHPSRGE